MKLEFVDDDEEEEDVVGEEDNEAAAETEEEEDTAKMAEEIKVTWETLLSMLICLSIVMREALERWLHKNRCEVGCINIPPQSFFSLAFSYYKEIFFYNVFTL